MCDPCSVCCCCITHYQAVGAPDIGGEVIDSHDSSRYTMIGDTMPLVEILVPPQHTMIGEPGAMCYFESGIEIESKFDDGAYVEEQSNFSVCRKSCARSCSGEASSLAHFENKADVPRILAFGNDTPGHIVAIDLDDVEDNVLFTMNGSFVFGPKGTRIDIVRADCKQCCCGAGLCFQKIDGNGHVFLTGGGTVIKQDLDDETHRIDPSSLLGFTKGLEVNVQRAGGCWTMCCGGEGFAMTTLSGTGSYWLSSSPNSSQIQYALQFLPPKR
eukprot:TRINITY_DN41210_c0_g1_i1.p1 TRINITY_DN41210_c0_g1~~TRINITY_DN41210_c0_g1_i1.p1  ORF type:complete len:271 (+),score=39.43 TRINITY_DN41210_c0_g1_i1:79-891(+)